MEESIKPSIRRSHLHGIAQTVLCVSLVLVGMFTANGQNQQAPLPPATKLETLQSQTGILIVRAFTKIGVVRGNGGNVELFSFEVTDATNGGKERGIAIDVEQHGTVERTVRAYIDYDEIDPLIKSVEALSKIGPSVTTEANFEARYSTRGDFTIATFNESDIINVLVTAGSIDLARVYLKFVDLEKFKGLLSTAKSRVDAAK
jgi:hypothetical protein